tara:strand:- start:2114 stop:2395 length:282 start_codon:yes stop_codon:yes gene_type:complete
MKYTFNKQALLNEILSLDLPKGLRLTLIHKCKKFGLDKVLINSNHGIEIVSKYYQERNKNKYTGRYNTTNILNSAWLNLDDKYNGLQVIDLRR